MNSIDKTNTLIYFVCFGERYKKFVNKAIYSLFNTGKYTGDVAVITHFNKEEFECNDRVNVLKIDSAINDITYFRNAKPTIINLIDITKYEYVIYLDCDILINTDKINSLILSWAAQSNNIVIQKDIMPIRKNKPYCGAEVLTQEEKVKYGNYAFNAGIIGANSTLFHALCDKWHNKNKEYNFTKDDQGNLIFVIVRNYIDIIKYTNDTTITNRKNDEKRTETILHFLTKSEQAFYSYFDKYIKRSL
jgi:lipopolysaccharide biosynthesis glycosyltransferase